MNAAECPFCNLPEDHVLARTDMAVAFFARFPVSAGHVLVIPEVHVSSLLELPEKDLTELWSLVAYIRNQLKAQYQPAGFNIGINEGVAAGQTVAHAHIHIIPRYAGDVADPRGGIRWVVPAKAKYWELPP